MIGFIYAGRRIKNAITPRRNGMQWLTSTHGDDMREAEKTSTQKAFRGKDETGNRFTRLFVLERIGKDRFGNSIYRCQCDCGATKEVRGMDLRSGNTTSCGCLKNEKSRERLTKHGLTESPEYIAWQAMKNRCYREKDEHFHRYGGRGITVCPEWLNNFQAFYDHVGPRPSNRHSIHRIENDGNYEVGNVAWETRSVQANTRSTNRFIEFNGKSQTLSQWSRETGIGVSTIHHRLKTGWTIPDALTQNRWRKPA